MKNSQSNHAESSHSSVERSDASSHSDREMKGGLSAHLEDLSVDGVTIGRLDIGSSLERSGSRTETIRKVELPEPAQSVEAGGTRHASGKLEKVKLPEPEKNGETGRNPAGRLEKVKLPKPEQPRPAAERTDRAAEGKEINPALREIDLKHFDEAELQKTEKLAESLSFTDGRGETVTYHEAAERMIGDLESALRELQKSGRSISDEQIEAICGDAGRAVYSQEAESESRAINHHGIPHLYGVYERIRDVEPEVLEEAARRTRERHPGSQATAADIRAALVMAAVYHDEGYLSSAANEGVNHAGNDSLHGVDSAISFEHTHAPLYQGAVDEAVLSDTRQAILEHNVVKTKYLADMEARHLVPEGGARASALQEFDRMKASDMDPNENFIRSALLSSDKMAADTEEKVPEVLRDPQRLGIVIRRYYEAQEKGLLEKDADQSRLRQAQEELREELRQSVTDDPALADVEKRHYLEAIDDDISLSSGSFVLPLVTIVTPADAVRYSVSDGKIRESVTITTTLEDPDIADLVHGFPPKRRQEETGKAEAEPASTPAGKKLTGILDDLGIGAGQLEDIRENTETGAMLAGLGVGNHLDELRQFLDEHRDIRPEDLGVSEKKLKTLLENNVYTETLDSLSMSEEVADQLLKNNPDHVIMEKFGIDEEKLKVLKEKPLIKGVWLEKTAAEGREEGAEVYQLHTEGMKHLEDVSVYIRIDSPETQKPSFSQSVQTAMEAREEYVEDRRQEQLTRSAIDRFDRLYEEGKAGDEQVLLEYLGALYADEKLAGQPALEQEINEICDELRRLEMLPDQRKMDELAERVKRLPVEEKMNDISGRKNTPEEGKP